MKLIKKDDIAPITPHPEVELYRYQGLLDGINVNICYQLPHTTREGATPVANLCFVLEGSLEVICKDKTFTMEPGDAASFEASEDKTMANNSDEKVKLMLIDLGTPGGGPGGPRPGRPGGPSHDGPDGPPRNI